MRRWINLYMIRCLLVMSKSVCMVAFFLTAILTSMYSGFASSKELPVVVDTAFIDVHSGPANEYPVFHVAEQGELIYLVSSRTGWYKVRIEGRGGNIISGWISQESVRTTRLQDGSKIDASSGSFEDYQTRDWEITLSGGVLDNISALTLTASWVWTRNLSLDASYTQALGDFSDNKIWSLRMRHTVFPSWRLSPYLALGTGEIRTKPRANLVQSGDEVRMANHYEVGAGIRYYLGKSVLIRAEYRSLLALTDRDEQERLDQWLLGASVFF